MKLPNRPLNRRRFIQAGSAMLTVPLSARMAQATTPTRIRAVSRILEVNGKAAKVFGLEVNGSSKGLTTRYGKMFDVVVENGLFEETLIHWHGLTPPAHLDGVPMLSGPAIAPGDSMAVTFENTRTGTHWMHSHMSLQEQKLLAAPLIVQEDGAAIVDEQEHVIMLHDFTFRDPAEILSELQGGGGLHAGHGSSHKHGEVDHSQMAHGDAPAMPNDIAFDAMLANDRTLDDPEVVVAEKGGRFRLRIINAAAASNFWIELGAIEGQLIAVDGNAIYPVSGRRFPLAVAQRADIRLQLPPGSGAWPILFHVEGSRMRCGLILRAGDGDVAKIGDANAEAAPLDLALETKLKSVAVPPEKPVAKIEMVMLTGGGSDYIWGLNGKASMHDVIFNVKRGNRYEIAMHNMTSMAHPMHLHGHYFKVVEINGTRINGALRDTILVPVNALVRIQFDADNPGTWAFHCHHLYHMNSGMMGAIAYTGAA